MSTVVDLGALGSSGLVILGDAPGDRAGFSVSSAGDFNGDGIDDIIIGAPFNDSGGANSGSSYLIYGRADGIGTIDLGNLQAASGFKIQGEQGGDAAGMSVSGAGDINGDGFDDIVVAASRAGFLGYGATPRAYVIFGTASAPATIDLTGLAASAGFHINGQFGGDTASFTVAAAGDVNGDGLGDIILGSPDYGAAAYVVFGKETGFTTLNVSNLGADGFAITATTGLAGVGQSVSGAGDINGDGFDDIIVSASRTEFYGTTPAAYVVFGKESGFATVDLNSLPAADGFAISGFAWYGNNGFSVSGAGDVNGDGFADIIVGGTYDYGLPGAAYVIFGKDTGFGSIDLNNLASADGFAIHNQTPNIGGFSVSAAGDINGDGFADLIVGDSGADGGGTDSGDAYVLLGRASGFGTIDLANLSPDDGFILRGDAAGDRAGFSVSGGADVNGDGIADIIVGAPYGDGGGMDAGAAYVIFGTRAEQPHHPSNDFDGDGRSDILWRNDAGIVTDWLGTGTGGFTPNWDSLNLNLSLDLQIVGTGDFNADGRADLLTRATGGELLIALVSTPQGGLTPDWENAVNVPVGWHVVGTGDFNGDTRTDILWRNDNGRVTDWLASESGGLPSFDPNWDNANANVPAAWAIIGTGDFNGDGRDDILWRNSGTGVLTDWLGTATGGFSDNYDNARAGVGLSWTAVGTGDFNGDGRDDILWRSDTGVLTDWLGAADGGFAGNYGNSAVTVSLAWTVAATGDFNGDGRDDILWRNDTGAVADWLGAANGGFTHNGVNSYTGVPLSWEVEPHAALI